MDGKTALHFAAENNMLSVCQKIIEVGGQDKPEDDDGNTPFLLALFKGHREVCELLSDPGLTFNHFMSNAKFFHAYLSKRRKLS